MTTCPHCDAPVVEGVMRGTGRTVLLDPEPGARGNLEIIEPGSQVRFIPKEHRDPEHRFFVPPEQRYRSHMVSCPQNMRSTTDDLRAFVADVDRRLKTSAPHLEGGIADPECAPGAPDFGSGEAPGSATPVHVLSSR